MFDTVGKYIMYNKNMFNNFLKAQVAYTDIRRASLTLYLLKGNDCFVIELLYILRIFILIAVQVFYCLLALVTNSLCTCIYGYANNSHLT